MGLPKLQHPTFELTIPSTKEQIRYRPFLVKEEKILLIAQESGAIKDIIVAVKQIIKNCIVEGEVDVELAPSFDIEYIFLMLRANSISDVSKILITDPDTEKTIPIEVNLKEIQVKENKDHTNIIKVSDDVTLEMRYPNYNDILYIESKEGATVEATLDMVKRCVNKVYSGEDEVHEFKDYSDEEVDNFIESINSDKFKNIQNFFETMPTLEHTVNYKVGKKTKQHTLSGMQSFFS